MLERHEYDEESPRVRPESSLIEQISAVRRQYARAKEYCGLSIDDIINSRSAQCYLSEVWLLGCMIRKPRKAQSLPEKIRLPNAIGVIGKIEASASRPR